jgi:hypothetical protein
MHQAAVRLGTAMDEASILVYPNRFQWSCPRWAHGTNEPPCRHAPTFECFFLPLSNCSPVETSVIRPRATGVNGLKVPRFLENVLNGSSVEPQAYARYWIDHAVSYLTRLNRDTIHMIEERMRGTAVLSTWETRGFDVTVHIRHGDKYREMPLVEDRHYMNVVEMLRQLEGRNLSVFLATDDPISVSFFRNQSGVQLYDIPRMGYSNFMESIYYLSNLWALTRCKFTVGTYSSNVDRWLRGLMNVVSNTSSSLFFEVGWRPCLSVTHCRAAGLPYPVSI